ncbi:MAG: hypothetical protein V5A44_08820, partial [Haloarculaceae archaeon]
VDDVGLADAKAADDSAEAAERETEDESTGTGGEDGDPQGVESREAIEESLDGVVPMVGERPDPEPDGHDEDAEVTPDAD